MKAKRTELDRQIEYQRTLADTFKSIHYQAIREHLPHSWVLAQHKSRIYETQLYSGKKLARHVKEYLSGYSMALLDATYPHLFSGVLWEGQAIPMKWDSLPEACKEEIRQDRLKGQYFYIGTNKPF